MADPVEGTAHATHAAGKGGLDFLKQKVGPLPLGVWLAAGIVILWYFYRNNQSSTSAAGANQQTDPAGNVGSIDPSTGYVYGSPEDQAALASNDETLGTGSSGQNATTGAQTYADNNAWGIAAVNYLVGLGIDATTANQAVQQYLSSQVLTTAQQGDVNLAIQALGPPPSLPGPTTGNPTPVTGGTGTGGTTVSGQPKVTNGHVVSAGATNGVVAWTGTNATKWQTKIVGPGKINGQTSTVGIPQATYSGLESGHDYTVTVTPLVNGSPVASAAGKIDFKTSGGTPATTAKKK